MKLNELTIKKAQEGLKEKKFSSEELVKDCLKQIKEDNPKLNAFITVCEEEAIREAKAIDCATDVKESPLQGIPIAVKDLYCTKGVKTTAGSKVLENYIPVYDSTVVAKLKNAGAIIIGKTNCDAWAHGASGENSDFGSTHNPWDFERIPGGSSSGSAVAVASNECLASIGTDTGGSIRLPASFCNVVGLKPTYGRVSRYGVISMASSLDCMGHFTKSVEDSALMLEVIAGYDPKDATTSEGVRRERREGGVRGVKIGIPKEYFGEGLDPKIKDKVMEAVGVLEDFGAEIIEVSLPHTKYALSTYYIIQPSEVSSNLARYDGIRFGSARQNFGDEAKRRIMLGTYTLSAGYYDAYYLKAMKVRTLIKKDFDDVFNPSTGSGCDVIIAPVSPTLPFKIGEKVDDPLQMYLADIYTVTANLVGIPGLSVPVGFIDGLPVGMQILGPQFSESKLFQVGQIYEQQSTH